MMMKFVEFDYYCVVIGLSRRRDDHVVMVTHQPFVSHAVAHWTDDATLAPIAPGGYSVLEVLDLQRGGVTCLRHCPDPAVLMAAV